MKKQFTEEKPDGYTGLLLLRCERCGQVRAFYTKNPLVRYYCQDCGRTTPLDNLIPAYVRCGNAVTPPVPAALVRSNLPEYCHI